LFYVLPVYLVFWRFKLLKLTRLWRIVLPLPPLVCLLLAWFALGRYTPMCQNAYLQAPVTQISAQVPGMVVQVHVRENETVQAGQPLFQVDPTPFELQARQAEAKLWETKERGLESWAALYAAEQNLQAAESRWQVARLAVTRAVTDRAAAVANVEKLEAQVRLADAELERAQLLVQDRAMSEQEFEEKLRNQAVQRAGLAEANQGIIRSNIAIETAQAQVIAAEAAWREAQAGRTRTLASIDPQAALTVALQDHSSEANSSSTQQSPTESVTKSADNKPSFIERGKIEQLLLEAEQTAPQLHGRFATVIQAENAWKYAEYQREQSLVRAPSTGTIVNMQLTTGTTVGPNKPAMALLDKQAWKLVLPLPENGLGRVRPGDEVHFALRSQPLQLKRGQVKYIVPGVIAGQAVPSGALPDTESRLGRQFDSPETAQYFQVIVEFPVTEESLPELVGATGHAVILASGGLTGVNSLALLLLTINSGLDYFYPKPSLLVWVGLAALLAIVFGILKIAHRSQPPLSTAA